MAERTLSVTDAARNFADAVNRAYYRNESTLLVRNGVPVARLVPAGRPGVTARDLAERWSELPRLGTAAAAALERDLAAARRRLRPPRPPRWA